ncbi:MAG: ATP-binding cassette domain-containing protein, partial [Verrucomicrobiae bacterium]|nr:ATP-binding cassette domain-containing protein [Verrucomicrobiae bacterium]
GCGKTTLMKMVNRLYDPSAGTLYWDRRDIQQINATELRRQIGYVIQQIGLFPHMTVADNVKVVPKLLGWKAARMAERADELLAQVDLPPDQYRDRYPAQLSGGQQQRVGVARALAGDPDLILMDEPFGALDPVTRQNMQDLLVDLWRDIEATVFFITHDVSEAVYLADRVYILSNSPGTILEESLVPPPDRPARAMQREPEFLEHVQRISDQLERLEEGRD